MINEPLEIGVIKLNIRIIGVYGFFFYKLEIGTFLDLCNFIKKKEILQRMMLTKKERWVDKGDEERRERKKENEMKRPFTTFC